MSNDQIYDILFNGDEVTWQSIIYDLIKSNEIDAWDIDLTVLTKKFLEALQKIKGTDFRISGKVVLAAAMLLKIKSKRFIEHDIQQFDELFKEPEVESLEDFMEGDLDSELANLDKEKPKLIPRTPQPRERKVTIFDLVSALEKALEVKKRKVGNFVLPERIQAPEKVRDITAIMRDVLISIQEYTNKNQVDTMVFDDLLKSDKKKDKIYTFIPLLHLTNAGKVDLNQDGHFSQIQVKMLNFNK